MEDIFKRWIETGNLTQDDIIPVLMEYAKLYEKGTCSQEQLMIFMQTIPMDWNYTLTRALTLIGKKLRYSWIEVYDNKGLLIKRFWNE